MSIADAIIEFEKQLHSAVVVLDSGFGSHPGENDRIYRKRKELAEIALHALRAQQEAEQGCDKCSGIVYRQTASGKVIPIEQKCGVKITPPCYQQDGDGCAYQVYGDNNDEPIERCKECPLCHSDKVRHHEAKKNEPLTAEELREMEDGKPVWCVIKGVHEGDAPCLEAWFLLEVEEDFEGEKVKEKGFWAHNPIYCNETLNFDSYGDEWLAYRHKPEEEDRA